MNSLTRIKTKLEKIVEDTDTRAGRTFDMVVQTFIVLSLISFSLETLPTLPGQVRSVLAAFEIATVILFTTEYLLRLFLANQKLNFIFSFYGFIDLLAILPFFVAGIDLRSVRIFRLFRLFRMLKLFRYNRAIERFRKTFVTIKEELVLFLLACVFLIYVTSVGIYYFERNAQPEAFSSVFHAMWWAVATLTTVGYGDIYPITVGGRIFTTFILFIGLGIIAVPAGLVASALSKTLREEKRETT